MFSVNPCKFLTNTSQNSAGYFEISRDKLRIIFAPFACKIFVDNIFKHMME